MSDKILKEAFDKMVAIEEGAFDDQYGNTTDRGPTAPKNKPIERVPGSEHDRMMSNLESRKKQKVKEDRSDAADGAEELTGIQEELFEIIERLDSAIRAYVPRKHAYWQSYGLAQLKIVAGSDEYASNDESINNLIEVLSDEMNHGDDDDERDMDGSEGRQR